MVALGGWTFNDPGATQRVFHDVASTKANRAKFIGNLLSFLRQYAYDGVDFDWVGTRRRHLVPRCHLCSIWFHLAVC